ncbi:MAG: DUF1015 domain-containing protein, partial [Actinobacteria bacterium]|nr:DUF1015 domain-containing protein [Actinomycetota bacterium]
ARNPHNVVHLTLPDSPEDAARDLAAWRADGTLQEEQPALWFVAQDYVGPDGVARTREGLAGGVEATPYEAGQILPHERTHAGPKEGRLRLLRATHTQLEPIFLLYDAEPVVERPSHEPDLDVEEGGVRTRLWKLPPGDVDIDVPFLIADGHHRYETAVAFREEEPSATHTFAILVSSRAPGLEIFPTHRIAEKLAQEPPDGDGELRLYRDGAFHAVPSDDELDARAVERYVANGVRYTPYEREAVAAVDRGEAEAAFIVRAPSVAQVAAFATRGETMPQKSTFFYPKLTSGLLFFPVG